MNTTAITAHSGSDGTMRDSLSSLEKGIALGADCVEVDVRLDAEGRLRLSHDARTDYQGAAFLQDALRRVAEAGAKVNCDLKQPAALYPVLRMAESCGLERDKLILSGSVSLELLAADADVSRRAQVFLNIEEICKFLLAGRTHDMRALFTAPWDALRPEYESLMRERMAWVADTALNLGASALNLPYQGVTRQHIDFFRRQGIGLSLWTVNSAEDIASLLRARVKNITTLHVAEALRLRASVAP